MREKEFLKKCHITETAMCISGTWLLVGIVRSLYSSHIRGFFSDSLCENFNELISQASNHKAGVCRPCDTIELTATIVISAYVDASRKFALIGNF